MPNPGKYGSIDSAAEFLSRRRMLAASAAAVGSGFAGCLGGDDGNGNGNGSSNGNGNDSGNDNGNGNGNGNDSGNGEGNSGSGGDTTITTFMQSIPREMNFNTWAPSYPWSVTWVLLEPVIRYYADGSTSLEMIDDWDYNGDSQELTVHFNNDFVWWNGDQVKAADKYWFEKVARLLNPEASNLAQITLENDGQTLVRKYKDQQNPQLLEYALGGYLGEMLRTHRDSMRPWAEELEDATSGEERTNIEERMAEEMPLNIQTVMEDGLGNGPFQIVDFDEQGIYCELHDGHPYSDQIDIDRLDYELAADEAVAQNIMGGEYDFGYSTLANWLGDSTPDNAETIAEYQDTFMRKLEFEMQGPGSKHTRNLNFRRAVIRILNLEDISANESSETTSRTLQTGLPENVTAEWLGEYVNDFIEYPTQTDESGATELLQAEGYEQDGDAWIGPDGEQVSLEFVVPQRWSNPARTITDQLSQFGFEVNISALEGASYNDRTEDSIGFDLTIFNHGSLGAHPSRYFRPTHKAGNDLGEQAVIEQAIGNDEERSPYNGKEFVVEIPEEVGQEDLSGSTQEINLYESFQEWSTAQSDEQNQEFAETFTWLWNFYLPGIDMYEQINGSWGKTSEWNFDVNEEWEAYRGAFRALKRGYISPQ